MDDIFVIVLFSAFTAMVQGEGVSASSFVSIPVSIVTGVILGALVGAAVDISYTLKAGPLVLVMLCISLIFRACGVFICLLGTKLSKKGKAFLRDSLYPEGYGAGGNRLCALGFGTCVRQHSAFGGRCRHTLYGAFGMDMTAHRFLEKY